MEGSCEECGGGKEVWSEGVTVNKVSAMAG